MGAFDDLIPQSQSGTQGGGTFDDLIPSHKADPKIGRPEELTFAEKHIAPLLELAGLRGATKGGVVGRTLKGASDPAVAAAQMVANVLPGEAGASVNKWVSDQEKQYQADRAIEGSTGVDLARAGGSLIATAPLGAVGAGVARGAAIGAGTAALDPVREEGNFWGDKGQQAAIGAVGGAIASPLLSALARVVSPKASTDASVKMLRDEGVNLSFGQTLGGWANTLEQKAMSLPFVGDAVRGARREGVESFNEAALARALPAGRLTKGAGHEGVKEVGDVLSSVYEGAAKNVGHVNLVGTTFDKNMAQLQQMTSGLSPELATRFDRVLQNEVLRRMSPNGSVAGVEIKKIDSALGKIAADWRKSMDPSQREFGDAVRQLQQNFRDGLAEVDPAYAAAKAKADAGWAMLKRTRKAATSAKNEEGVFSPAQLNAAVQQFDNTVGKRATAEGDALLQDLARAGQRLGNKVPDSGTAGRLMAGPAALAAVVEPLSLAGVAAGYGIYSKAGQNLLRAMVLRRPDQAPAVANYLRQLSAPAALASGTAVQEYQ
jgi:hypothetical protein